MKRIAAIVLAAAILILFAASCAAPEPVYVLREVTVVATLTPPIGTPPPPQPTALPSGGIAFTSRRDGNYEIYVMNADGSGQTNLSNDPKTDADPCWSPDGARIAFTSHRERTTNPEIFVMNADGSGQTNLTQSPGADQQPDWSPDGSRIVFSSERDGNWEIYMMNADGSGQTNLTHQRTWELSPSWSPDSHTIVFSSSRGCVEDKVENCAVYEIYTIQYDGSALSQLTETGSRNLSPAWSPDGSRIAFVSERDGNAEIYVMDSDGTDQTRLTHDPGADESPAWSPDGRYLVFSSDRNGNQEIYVMRADGSGVSRLTDNEGWDGWPAWTRAFTPVPPSASQENSEFQWLVLEYKGDPGRHADAFVESVMQRVIELVPQFEEASYTPDLLKRLHEFAVEQCFPPRSEEFNIAIRFASNMTVMRRFARQGDDFHTIVQLLGLGYGLELERWEIDLGEQCVVRE